MQPVFFRHLVSKHWGPFQIDINDLAVKKTDLLAVCLIVLWVKAVSSSVFFICHINVTYMYTHT